MSNRAALARTVGQRKGWVKRGLHRIHHHPRGAGVSVAIHPALAVTVDLKVGDWAHRGLHRMLPEHRRLLAGYEVCTAIVGTPPGIYGAVSVVDGTKHENSQRAREWDAARKAFDKKAMERLEALNEKEVA